MLLTKSNLELAQLISNNKVKLASTFDGILVSPAETVVTDGHLLVAVETNGTRAESFPDVPGLTPAVDDWAPFVLNTGAALSLAKSIPNKSNIPVLKTAAVLDTVDGKRNIAVTDLQNVNRSTVHLKDCPKFPDHKFVLNRAVQPGEEEFSITFNPALLSAVLDFITKSSGAKRGVTHGPSCTLRFKTSGDAVRIDSKTADGEKITALVMPMQNEPGTVDTTPGVIRSIKRSYRTTADLQTARNRLASLRAQVAELERALIDDPEN